MSTPKVIPTALLILAGLLVWPGCRAADAAAGITRDQATQLLDTL